MARLTVRLDTDGESGGQLVEVADAIQYCLKKRNSYRLASNVIRAIGVTSGVAILTLATLFTLDDTSSGSTRNDWILYFIIGLAATSTLTQAIKTEFQFEREAVRYESAARAVQRVRDQYVLRRPRAHGAEDLNRLAFWVKSHVRDIEALLDNPWTVDVDSAFRERLDGEQPQQTFDPVPKPGGEDAASSLLTTVETAKSSESGGTQFDDKTAAPSSGGTPS